MIKRVFASLILVSAVLMVTASVNAQITVTQVGGELFVMGGIADDSIYVGQEYYSNYVYVFDFDAGVGHVHYGVDKVWVDTGNGDDQVRINDYYTAYNGIYENAAICVNTGNGNDRLNIEAAAPKSLEIYTGNEDDYVYSYSWGGIYYGGSLSINTENGQDECLIRSYGDNLDVDLGNGKDIIGGVGGWWTYDPNPYTYTTGTIDGGNGKDSCSNFTDYGGLLDIVNCED